jgi:hypothetical protein
MSINSSIRAFWRLSTRRSKRSTFRRGVFSLPEREYQGCSPAHVSPGFTTALDGKRMSINVELIGGSLVVQHYVETLGRKDHPIQALDGARQVIALCGDGGFNMLMCEFLTAVHHKLPVKVVVFNNTLGMITLEAEANMGLPAYKQAIDFPNRAGARLRRRGLQGRKAQ